MRRLAASFATAIVFAAAPDALAAAAVEGPVAVMPFRNLNDDPDLDWMRTGIAETMVSDLQKSKRVTIVERAQVEKALGELLLQDAQGAPGAEDATAVKVGRLVGAKTVVLGSFQQAGRQLRINARFVAVETGVVLETAKTTGRTEEVFALQDKIVDRLLGLAGGAAGKPPPRPARKTNAKTVEAYRLYAMALTTASDADKVRYLKKSLAVDPGFVYAADELAALERRLEEYRRVREAKEEDRAAGIWAKLADAALPAGERSVMANQHLIALETERRYRAVVRDARRILEVGIPDDRPGVATADDYATWALFFAHLRLRETDVALQIGEQYLREFPQGAWYRHVEQQIQAVIAERRKREEGRALIETRFRELDAERAAFETKNAGKPWLGARLRAMDLERCWFPARNDIRDHERTVRECEAFLARHADDPEARDDLRQARATLAEALGELGRFDRAIPMAEALIAEDPKSAAARRVQGYLEWHWPRDALP